MKLGTFNNQDRIFPGLVEGEEVYDLSELVGRETKGEEVLKTLLSRNILECLRKEKVGSDNVYSIKEVKILAPILNPGKIICIGRNYQEHAEETNSKLPEEPLFFNKFATSIIGPGSPILLPRISKQVDYEAELAVVIGEQGKFIPEEEAFSHVAGYTVFNDISARDLQFRDGQWVKGKALDTFAPMGPFLVTPDEIGDPHDLWIRLTINDQVMQDYSTKMMIFSIPKLISFLSNFFTLKPGDIIATGTPPGVGVAREPQVFLAPGDQIRVSIEKVGELFNPVAEE